jgi:hypothetical protein
MTPTSLTEPQTWSRTFDLQPGAMILVLENEATPVGDEVGMTQCSIYLDDRLVAQDSDSAAAGKTASVECNAVPPKSDGTP